jgi:MoaA/NifB/PqqE/SkfB family radical SAM enzyme
MPTQRIYQLLKLNRLVRSHRIKFAGLLGLYQLRRRHLCLRFDPTMACNLRCQMCYFSDPEYLTGLGQRKRLDWPEIQRLGQVFFPWALQLYIGCATEPTTYKGFVNIIELGKKQGVPMIGLVTNGQLLTEEHITQFVELGLDELTLSTHGVERDTYERMMRRASYDKFLNVLEQVEGVKKRYGASRPELRLNYTVNADNLAELERFFEVYGKYRIATLQVRPIADLGNTEYKDKDLTPHLAEYNRTVHRIEQQCHARGIRLLANYDDVSYNAKSTLAALVADVLVYLSPQDSLPGFDWRSEEYYEYRRRTSWSQKLWRNVLAPADKVQTTGMPLSYTVIQ